MGAFIDYMARRIHIQRDTKMILAYENMKIALRNFETNMSEETDRQLLDMMEEYQRAVPQEVRMEVGSITGKDLEDIARLRLEQYHNATFASK